MQRLPLEFLSGTNQIDQQNVYHTIKILEFLRQRSFVQKTRMGIKKKTPIYIGVFYFQSEHFSTPKDQFRS